MLERLRPLDQTGARRPREVVDVLAVKMMHGCSVRIVFDVELLARRADDEAARNRHPDVIDAVIGVELSARVELMRVPAGIFEDSKLREPLPEEVVVVDVAGARERPRNLRAPLEIDVDRFVRGDLCRERHRKHRSIRGIAIVRGDVTDLWRIKLIAVPDPKYADIGPDPRIGSRGVGVAAQASLAQPRGVSVAPGIPIQMKLQLVCRMSADVAP